MKIVNAFWEKRNLGCDAYEITLDRNDLKDFAHTLEELHAQSFEGAYVTLKMPVGDLKALHALEDEGFRFMETQFSIERSLNDYETNPILKRHASRVTCEEIKRDEAGLEDILSRISDKMFTTDRIYLDPLVKEGVSTLRYKNWMRDFFKRPEIKFLICKYGTTEIAFDMAYPIHEKGEIHDILGGIYDSYTGTGYGLLNLNCLLVHWKELGFKKFITNISSNNTDVLSSYMFFGAKITQEKYVLRKYSGYVGEKNA